MIWVVSHDCANGPERSVPVARRNIMATRNAVACVRPRTCAASGVRSVWVDPHLPWALRSAPALAERGGAVRITLWPTGVPNGGTLQGDHAQRSLPNCSSRIYAKAILAVYQYGTLFARGKEGSVRRAACWLGMQCTPSVMTAQLIARRCSRDGVYLFSPHRLLRRPCQGTPHSHGCALFHESSSAR
jgi:hypothetical protein